jgi:hypothetical protein
MASPISPVEPIASSGAQPNYICLPDGTFVPLTGAFQQQKLAEIQYLIAEIHSVWVICEQPAAAGSATEE